LNLTKNKRERERRRKGKRNKLDSFLKRCYENKKKEKNCRRHRKTISTHQIQVTNNGSNTTTRLNYDVQ